MSLVICTVLYIIVVAILNGMVPFNTLNVAFPVAFAVNSVGLTWAALIISFGAIAGLTTVLLVMMYGQTRIFYAMSRDGLIPPVFVRLHPTWRTPWLSQIIFGILIATAGAFFPIGVLGSLTNMGTFLAFILVACSVPLLRNRHPEIKGIVYHSVRPVHHSGIGCRERSPNDVLSQERQPGCLGILSDRMVGISDLVCGRSDLLFLVRAPKEHRSDRTSRRTGSQTAESWTSGSAPHQQQRDPLLGCAAVDLFGGERRALFGARNALENSDARTPHEVERGQRSTNVAEAPSRASIASRTRAAGSPAVVSNMRRDRAAIGARRRARRRCERHTFRAAAEAS